MNDPRQSGQVFALVANVLLLGIELRTASNLPTPQVLRQRLIDALDDMVGRGRQQGIDDTQLAEARYALTAFLDEQILKARWTHHGEWVSEPLERALYKTREAGNHFFERLRGLLGDGTKVAALEVYYLCIALGFRGAYAEQSDPQGLAAFLRTARGQLQAKLPSPDKLAPNVMPRDRAPALRTSNGVAYAIAASCLLFALGGTFLLQWAADRKLNSTLSQIEPGVNIQR